MLLVESGSITRRCGHLSVGRLAANSEAPTRMLSDMCADFKAVDKTVILTLLTERINEATRGDFTNYA